MASSKLEATFNVRRPQQWLLHSPTTTSPADFKRFLIVEDGTVTPSSASIFCRSSGDVRQRPLRLYWTSAHFCLTDVYFGLPLRQPLTQSLSDASWCHKLFWHLPSLSTHLQTANAHVHQYCGTSLQLEASFSVWWHRWKCIYLFCIKFIGVDILPDTDE